jgi:hypothetical protein
VLLTPLPNLIFVGMEGVAQTLSILLLVLTSIEALIDENSMGTSAALLAAAFFAGAVRYEAVFAVVPICLLLVLRRRVLLGALTGVSAAITPAAFGLYAHRMSGFWLPFSILMKQRGAYASLHDRLVDLIHSKLVFSEAMVLLAAMLFLRRRRGLWDRTQLLLALTLGITLLHSLKVPTGTLLRYDSYLVALIVFALAAVMAEGPPKLTMQPLVVGVVLLGAIFAVHLAWRSAKRGTLVTEQAAVDRYHDHLQMARFVGQFYDHDTVVLNDVGLVAFYTDAPLLDLAGLGSAEPVHAAAAGRLFRREEVAAWAASRNASIAIVQPQWFYVARITPPNWTLVGTWRLPRDVVFGDPVVAFYAITPQQVPRLCGALAAFALPAGDVLTVQPGLCSMRR